MASRKKNNKYGSIDRNYYGFNGRQCRRISNNGHNHAKYKKFGEHAHDYIDGEDGVLIDRPARERT